MRPGTCKDVFNDVSKDAWYYDGVSIAYEYNLMEGYGSGKFGPMDKITREQAMTIVTRAMKITGPETGMAESKAAKILADFTDANSAADYAKTGIAACVKTGIIYGRSKTTLAPKDNITRAEAAVIIRRLLQQSGLI